MKYGFVAAGGGEWFSRTLKGLPVGARVFACIPKSGYVGVGTVRGPATRFVDAEVSVDDVPVKLAEQPLVGNYRRPGDEGSESAAEYIVPVRWEHTVPRDKAFWMQGMFANQNSACRLRNQFTIEQVSKVFDLDD